jgi:caffeoyl-CoA O-methyltransferase
MPGAKYNRRDAEHREMERMTTYNETLSAYIRDTFAAEDETLRWIRQECEAQGLPPIMINAEEGAFLHFLVAAIHAKRVVEIGTLGGYSGTWIARALPADGQLFTLEVDPEHAAVARGSFERAGLSSRVRVLEGDAEQTLPTLVEDGPYDFVFIDADKVGYPAYQDWALENLRAGGVLAAHNAFAFGGQVADEDSEDKAVGVIRQFNQRLADETRVAATIYPAGDGIAIAVLLQT